MNIEGFVEEQFAIEGTVYDQQLITAEVLAAIKGDPYTFEGLVAGRALFVDQDGQPFDSEMVTLKDYGISVNGIDIHTYYDESISGAAGMNLWIGDGAGNETMTNNLGYLPWHGSMNIGIGNNALSAIDIGFSNVAVGINAMKYNQSGAYNVAFGYSTLLNNVLGSGNVAIGNNALQANTNGNYNLAIGYTALARNKGSYNTGIGMGALGENVNGEYNTAIGYEALYRIGNSHNTAIGYKAGKFLANGTSGNTAGVAGVFIGDDTRSGINGAENEIVIGTYAIGHGWNSFTHGNTDIENHYFSGKFNLTQLNTAPSGVSDTGNTGEIRFTNSGIYFCIAANTWRKATISIF